MYIQLGLQNHQVVLTKQVNFAELKSNRLHLTGWHAASQLYAH